MGRRKDALATGSRSPTDCDRSTQASKIYLRLQRNVTNHGAMDFSKLMGRGKEDADYSAVALASKKPGNKLWSSKKRKDKQLAMQELIAYLLKGKVECEQQQSRAAELAKGVSRSMSRVKLSLTITKKGYEFV